MKYLVFRHDKGAEEEPFDEIDLNLMITEGCYIFYETRWQEPTVVYPVARFWLMKDQ